MLLGCPFLSLPIFRLSLQFLLFLLRFNFFPFLFFSLSLFLFLSFSLSLSLSLPLSLSFFLSLFQLRSSSCSYSLLLFLPLSLLQLLSISSSCPFAYSFLPLFILLPLPTLPLPPVSPNSFSWCKVLCTNRDASKDRLENGREITDKCPPANFAVEGDAIAIGRDGHLAFSRARSLIADSVMALPDPAHVGRGGWNHRQQQQHRWPRQQVADASINAVTDEVMGKICEIYDRFFLRLKSSIQRGQDNGKRSEEWIGRGRNGGIATRAEVG